MIIVVCATLAMFAFLLLMKVLWVKANVSVKPSTNIIIAASVVLVGTLGILIASGRMHWLAAAGTAVLPFLRRGIGLLRFAPFLANLWQTFGRNQSFTPNFGGLGTNNKESAPKISETRTDDLIMRLDHQNAELTGEILRGNLKGRSLKSLTDKEIVDFYNLASHDSKRLLTAYIQRYRPNLSTQESAQQDRANDRSSDTMTIERAQKILGVGESATRDEIIEAHRRLMQKNHPDRGGSEYIAAEINLAKDTLLDSL